MVWLLLFLVLIIGVIFIEFNVDFLLILGWLIFCIFGDEKGFLSLGIIFEFVLVFFCELL